MLQLMSKVKETFKEEGFFPLIKKTFIYIKSFFEQRSIQKHVCKDYFDVIFVNGCGLDVPHPIRYRITHQKEQLLANGIFSSEVFYGNLNLDYLRCARVFIFFRCPYTEVVGKFIKKAKKLNKTVLFDIDDLVVDTKYTDKLKYLDAMTKSDRKLYDEGVKRMGKTLQLCEAAITTTKRLATELSNYVPGEVFINRNTASETMREISEKAWHERDILPNKNKNEMNKEERKHFKKACLMVAQRRKQIRIGYFSGSITHNDDFNFLLPVIVRVMSEKPNVELHLMGELDIPKALIPFKNRLRTIPFSDWKCLPQKIASVDINIVPLKDTIFNEAKSENKWVEASLVKVPTIASDVGAFSEMIKNNETGVLCKTEQDWYEALTKMVDDEGFRNQIANAAYKYCSEHCLTMYTGFPLAKYIRKSYKPNIMMALPSLNISGGIMVALKHCVFLQDAGFDVTLLVDAEVVPDWFKFEKHSFPVLQLKSPKYGFIDRYVATMWTTADLTFFNNTVKKQYYLVQNFETDFYPSNTPLRYLANKTYATLVPIQYLTISKWCQRWLKNNFEKDARYAPNGLDVKQFYPQKRDFNGKIRILIEGDSQVDYKNVDESFKIANQLDPNKFEIWYMSYNGTAKSFYKVDKFLHKVKYEKVADVYRQCHILLKSSLLESFSYPPLEMIATGGFAVVAFNEGSSEYLVNEENCLIYKPGDVKAAVEAIERICKDSNLRDTLYENGQELAKSRSWENIREDILKLYE
ncbi:MAG: D-inositol-3-phosphate glycosyltransferase [Eubacteriales bacterium SKADARSKE-1]|nr:D-inositol-3-phosphate glycosyltransferase [Eubacteriales bacterium SKADARSKE-1]